MLSTVPNQTPSATTLIKQDLPLDPPLSIQEVTPQHPFLSLGTGLLFEVPSTSIVSVTFNHHLSALP
jgi:hypothetical protein